MGWNTLQPLTADALLKDVGADEFVYFVHSFAAPVNAATTATVQYGAALAAVVRCDNFHGTQFHPERSGRAGARVLRNFLEL
jgi:glutamine amidotransferase